VLDEMVRQHDGRAIPLTVELFQRVGGEERIDFEVMLLQFGDASVGPLLQLLDAADWHLVNRTMDTLGKLKSKRAVAPIIAKLQHKESWIQIKAAHSLGDIGDPQAIPALIPLLKSENYNVINAALIGLAKLKAQEAFEPCLALTRHTNPRVRATAAFTLGKLGDERAVLRLKELLNDEDKGVAALAQKALSALGQ
jgi:HEAT repeat protein